MEAHDVRSLLWVTGPWRKKFAVSEERRNNHSCPWVEPASYILGVRAKTSLATHDLIDHTADSFLTGVVYAIPNHEFCELAYDLPNFEDLPLFWNVWNADGKPDRIIVQNIQDGDTIAIRTEGYDYARYRASCKRLWPVV